jgi:ubiquinone/menaquinone biosynthesis C-methylase UbiE
MGLAEKLKRIYFDSVYNRVYDSTTAQLNRYRKLQSLCVSKLELRDGDKVLCAGVGTGNEILHILQTRRNVEIFGVDYSRIALEKAYKKALRFGSEIKVLIMDVRRLEFGAGSFDKVLCLHVMDFIDNNRGATKEILRVLKDGGQFVITYPSGKEGPRLGVNLLSDSVRQGVDSGKPRIRALSESLAQMLVGIIYLPLLFRPKRKSYSRSKLEAMLSQLATGDFQIEEDPVYQDFIVYGRK